MKNTARKQKTEVNRSGVNEKQSFFGKFLNMVEVVGNRLPHPVTIFIMLSVAVIIISEIASRAGVSVTYYDAKAKKDAVVGAVSLMNAEGLHYMFTHATSNFTGFAPLGTVLVAMLGVGVAEGTGLIGAAIKRVVLSTPKTSYYRSCGICGYYVKCCIKCRLCSFSATWCYSILEF